MDFYCIGDAPSTVPELPRDVGIVALSGEIDYHASAALKEHLTREIQAGRRRIVIDLSEVTFIDSTAIGLLVGTNAKLQELASGRLVLACPQENWRVHRILDVAGIAGVTDLHSSLEQAVTTLAVAA